MTQPKTAQQALLEYLRGIYPDWEHSGALQRQIFKNKDGTTATPRSLVRRAEELVEDGKLEVRYENSSALYRSTAPKEVYRVPGLNKTIHTY